MQSMSLRYFQREGARSLELEGVAEPVLLQGRDQEYLLVPVEPGTRAQLLDLVEGWAAVRDLHAGQRRAAEAGLDRLTDAEIHAEIRAARKEMAVVAGPRRTAARKPEVRKREARKPRGR